MRKRTWIGATAVLLSVAAIAADVSGTWTGVFRTREGGAFETVLTLKADGDKLTGTFQQGNSDEMQIENGKVTGDQISFSITRTAGDKTRKYNYSGKVEGNQLKLTSQLEGATRSQEVTLTRK